MANSKKKDRKPPLGYRVGAGLRAAGDAVSRPDEVPGKAYGWFRRWLGKVWKVRGGGLYASGYILTFLYFELTTVIDEFSDSAGVGDFFSEQIFEFLMRFSADSFINMGKSFMWPVYVVTISPPWGAVALGIGFWLFSAHLDKPVERWLLGDKPEPNNKD